MSSRLVESFNSVTTTMASKTTSRSIVKFETVINQTFGLRMILFFVINTMVTSALTTASARTGTNLVQKSNLVSCHEKSVAVGPNITVFHLEESKEQQLPYEYPCFVKEKLTCFDIPESQEIIDACAKCCSQSKRSFSKPKTSEASRSVATTQNYTGVTQKKRSSHGVIATEGNDGHIELKTIYIVISTACAVMLLSVIGYCVGKKCNKKAKGCIKTTQDSDAEDPPETLTAPIQVAEEEEQVEMSLLERNFAGL